MRFRLGPVTQDRLRKLARNIEAIGEKDAELIREAREISEMRRGGAVELHAICAGFVSSLNELLPKCMVELGPSEFAPATFRDPGANVFQINVSGRVIDIEFKATDELRSTEEFHIPYILHGSVRSFNQEMLEHVIVPETLLFYCLEKQGPAWFVFDPRTHRSAPFDQEYLISVMEKLV